MENITCAAELKLAITEKRFELEIQGQLLKDEFFSAYENLKPVNLIKNTLAEISASPYLMDNMLAAVMGMLSGYVSKKIAVGTSHNVFRKILGAVLQFGVTNLVTQHPDALKSIGETIVKKLFVKSVVKTAEE